MEESGEVKEMPAFQKIGHLDLDGWRNGIVAKGNLILSGLRTEEKFDLMRMSLKMLEMQIQNDRRFRNGMEAPCSYLWESHLSILGMLVSMIFPYKVKDFRNALNLKENRTPAPKQAEGNSFAMRKVYEVLLELGKKYPSGIDEAVLISEAVKEGMDKFEIKEVLEKLIASGMVYRPSFGRLKVLQ